MRRNSSSKIVWLVVVVIVVVVVVVVIVVVFEAYNTVNSDWRALTAESGRSWMLQWK